MPSPLTIPLPRHQYKPAPGTPLRSGHPLAFGLSRYILFNEGAGTPTIYLPANKIISTTVANPTGSGWTYSPYGPAFVFGSTSFIEASGAVDPSWCPTVYSMFAIVYPVLNGTNDRAITGSLGNNSAGEVQINSSGNIRVEQSFGSTFLTSTGTLPNNKWSTVGTTWDTINGNFTIAINGQKDSQILGTTKPSYTIGGGPSIGCWAGFGTASYWGGGGPGAMATIYLWYGRALTFKDFYELHNAPYCMF